MTGETIKIVFGLLFTAIISVLLYAIFVMRPREIQNHKDESIWAYQSGIQAAKKGLPETVNPYPPTNFFQSERLNWSMGYLSEKMK